MAVLKLDPDKLKHNFTQLTNLFEKNQLDWAVVTKLLSGNEIFLKEILKLKPKQLCDSRISNLRTIKLLDPSVETVYIKPVPLGSIESLLDVADISFNSELTTLKALSEASLRRGRKHKVIIAVELGDRREGVMKDELIDFFREVFLMKGIDVVGLGANLNCLNGVMPSEEKLLELSGYQTLIEKKFQKRIPMVSGGSSVTIPLIDAGHIPPSINHFRVGESLFFGADLFSESVLENFHPDVFTIEAEIIEISHKPTSPDGDLAKNIHGDVFQVSEEDPERTRWQGIIDIGTLDIASRYLQPMDPEISIVGSSSDMTVLELPHGSSYQIGSKIRFQPTYMVVLGLMNSRYVTKTISHSVEVEADEMDKVWSSVAAKTNLRA